MAYFGLLIIKRERKAICAFFKVDFAAKIFSNDNSESTETFSNTEINF